MRYFGDDLRTIKGNGRIDNYISKFANNPNDGDSEHANGDYTISPGLFEIKPPVGEVWDITRLIVYIEDTGSFDSGGYGNGSALTNGIEIKVYKGLSLIDTLTNSQPIKQNTHWKKFCFDILISTFGLGNESLGARWTFQKGGSPIRLDGDLGEKIVVECTDDLTHLVDQTFLFQGNKL